MGEWPSGLRRYIQNRKIVRPNPIRCSAGSWNEAPGYLRVESTIKKVAINIGLVRLSLRQWPKIDQVADKKSKMEPFPKIVNDFEPLTVFVKSSIFDV